MQEIGLQESARLCRRIKLLQQDLWLAHPEKRRALCEANCVPSKARVSHCASLRFMKSMIQTNFDLAKKDVEKALELAAEDAALKKLQARIERQLLIEKKKEAKMARKMFG